jgi:pyruvate/2-oxoglutarate dehydrogenase complex dihydrolipoamide acyltransferase (E2) component
MIRDVILPQLAMGMSEGTIVDWAVTEGEHVARDVPLLSIETEKVVTDIPAPCAGWLHRMAEPGGAIPVETVIGRIAETEAEYRSLLAIGPGDAALAASALPAALAPAPGQDRASLEPTTRGSSRRVKVSGLARKIAAQRAVDLGTVTGTGPGGRIVRRDVESALERRGASSATTAPAPPPPRDTGAAMRVRARVPMTGMRKAIAERMLRSKTTAAHAYVFFEVDVTRLLAARATMLEREQELGTRVSMIALYAKALSIAVRQVPACNATLQEQEIVIWDNVNIGIAVALPGKTEYESGLVVPVVRNVEQKGVVEIDRDIKTLVQKAKAGKLAAADTIDGTVTLSSSAGFMPGQWCVSTPLLNQPQLLNFQPGSPIEKPVVVDGQIVVRTILPCGLSFDHRAIDGEPVARFNRKISDLLAHPEFMLL